MAEDKRVVEARRDVAEARCQYCGRTFKSPRGRSIHERACKEKEHLDEIPQTGGEISEEVTSPSVTSASKEAAEIVEELAIPSPEDQKGGLKVDFRMPDGDLSDPSLEIRQLIAQMERERKRWEDERKKFLEQTEGLLMEEGAYTGDRLLEPAVKKEPHSEEVLLAEMKIASELDDLKSEIQKKVNIETMKELTESRQDVAKQLNDLDENVEALTTVLSEFSARTLDDLRTLSKKLDVKANEGDLDSLKEIIRRLDDKLEGVVEEVGFEESLDISKIPPRILELAYKTTLDDIAAALNRTLGEMDAEKVVEMTLEEVRARTSGSEMFRYQSPKFKIKGLASSIEKGLISAKQAQMTYEEILKRLKEHIPRHQAKSFRAMIKVKSQEFAVERSSQMAKEIDSMQNEVQVLRQSISEISKSLSDEISRIGSKLSEISGRLEDIGPTDDGLSEVEITNGFLSVEVPQEVHEEDQAPIPVNYEKEILETIPSKGLSFTKMRKKLEYEDDVLQSYLDIMVQNGRLEKKKRGKGFVYFVREDAEGEGGGS